MKREFKLEVADGIATITFNWPHAVNAMGRDYSADFQRMLDRVEANADARVLILTGAGKVFNGGGDLHEIMSLETTDAAAELALIRGYNKVAERLYYFDRPVIAAVNGPAAGGGVGIALACDFAIAAETARYDLAFHKIGLAGSDVGVPWFLTRAIGAPLTAYYVLTAGSIDAALGLRLGLFAKVVPGAELLAAARTEAARIAAAPREAVRISKLSLKRSSAIDLGANMELEAYLQGFAFRTPEHKQRLAKYRERLKEKK